MNAGSKSNRWFWLGGGAVVLLTLAAHVCGLRGQFVEWDDTTHITQNPAIRALTLDNLRLMFTQPIAKLYCPLTWLSFAVDYRVWGRDPFGYHVTNLVLHLANTVLVMTLVYRLLVGRFARAIPVALLSATLFGVHPLRVESVAWATERKDVLFAFFYLLSLGAFIRWTTNGKRSDYWGCFGLFIASALSKSTAVTLPAVLVLLDIFWRGRFTWRDKIPFLVVSAIIGAVTFAAQAGGVGETLASTEAIPVWARGGLVGYCSLFYVGKFFWPFHLSAIYPTFDELGWTPWTSAGWLVGFAAVTCGIVLLRRRAPVALPCWLFYLITLSPTIGLVPAGIHVVADRFSYLPLSGLAVAVSVGIVVAYQSLPRALGLASVGLIALTVLSARRTAVWTNTETLFQSVLREYPRCLPAHVNLTMWYTGLKRYDEAIAHGKQAVEIAPNGLPGRKNLAYALINAGKPREAIAVLRPAVEHGVEDPDVWRALVDCFHAVGDDLNERAARQRLNRLTSALRIPDRPQSTGHRSLALPA